MIHDIVIEVDDPTGNGTGAVRNYIHLDLVRVLTWLWALQPNAGYLSVRYPRQSHETNEHYADKKRGSTRVHVGYHPGRNVLARACGAKVRDLGLAAKVAYKRSSFENEQPWSFPRRGDQEKVPGVRPMSLARLTRVSAYRSSLLRVLVGWSANRKLREAGKSPNLRLPVCR